MYKLTLMKRVIYILHDFQVYHHMDGIYKTKKQKRYYNFLSTTLTLFRCRMEGVCVCRSCDEYDTCDAHKEGLKNAIINKCTIINNLCSHHMTICESWYWSSSDKEFDIKNCVSVTTFCVCECLYQGVRWT